MPYQCEESCVEGMTCASLHVSPGTMGDFSSSFGRRLEAEAGLDFEALLDKAAGEAGLTMDAVRTIGGGGGGLAKKMKRIKRAARKAQSKKRKEAQREYQLNRPQNRAHVRTSSWPHEPSTRANEL